MLTCNGPTIVLKWISKYEGFFLSFRFLSQYMLMGVIYRDKCSLESSGVFKNAKGSEPVMFELSYF